MTAITRALSTALLHFVWQGLVVTILFWLALFLLRKRSAALRYAASCAALALLLVLPAVTTLVLYEHPAAPGGSSVLVDMPGVAPTAITGGSFEWLVLAQTWAVPVWACGVLLFSLRMAWGCTQVAALRRNGGPADAQLTSAFSRLAGRMGVTQRVRLLLSTVTDSPSVTGWLRPVVLLPISAVTGLTPDQLEAVFAHELAHIRRHDYLVNLLQMVAEALLFYHPAVWWISARMRHERELCCDDLAVRACGGALSYARALTALEKMRAARPALAVGSTDGPLLYRIRRLVMGADEYGPSKLSGTIALSLGVACLALCVNWARGQEATRPNVPRAAEFRDSEGVTVSTAGATVLHRPRVEYPGTLMEKQVQGTVTVEASLDAAGNVMDARVLSGPDELRKVALSSVLNWHFSPVAKGSTELVQISFQTPSRMMKETKAGPELGERIIVTTPSPTGEAQTELTAIVPDTLGAERNRNAVTFLNEEVGRARERLAALESQPGADAEQVTKARLQITELERKIEIGQVMLMHNQVQEQLAERMALLEKLRATRENQGSTGENPELRAQIERLEGMLAERRASGLNLIGRKLTAIEVRGLSEDAGKDLQSRLPLHEGDTLTADSMEATTRVIRQFDEHLEIGYGSQGDGAVLRIHTAGAAGVPERR
jgi:beta-lactamase regulating signal transducer with metallopeptidase domain